VVVACLGGAPSARADDDVIAKWGTQPVTASEIKDLIPQLSPAAREQVANDPRIMKERVRSAIGRKVILDEALKQGWDKKPEVAAAIERARNDFERARNDILIHDYLQSAALPSSSFPSEQEVRTAYAGYSKKFTAPALYHLAQIFIAVPPDATPEVASAAKKKAGELTQKAKKLSTDFPTLARAESDEKFRAMSGGDLGWVAEKDLLKFVAEAGMAAHEFANGQRREIVGAEACQRAAEAADRSAHLVADDSFFGHRFTTPRPRL
jgi:peptidylprolyl isomerase